MNKLETIKLEPYEAPALEDLELSVLRGQEDSGDSNPSGEAGTPGGDTPPNEDDDF